MELLKSIVVDFTLFSLIESFIFCLFFEKIGECKKFRLIDVFIIGSINCLISQLIPPLFYQIFMIIFMGYYIFITKRKIIVKAIGISALSMIYILLIEMSIFPLYDILFSLDFSKSSSFVIFIALLPIRVIEILIILIGGKRMKAWAGEIVKRK